MYDSLLLVREIKKHWWRKRLVYSASRPPVEVREPLCGTLYPEKYAGTHKQVTCKRCKAMLNGYKGGA